jgi:hypothetical protein
MEVKLPGQQLSNESRGASSRNIARELRASQPKFIEVFLDDRLDPHNSRNAPLLPDTGAVQLLYMQPRGDYLMFPAI